MELIKSFKNIKIEKTDLSLLCALLVAFILRFVGLGYSDLQGDEIKALFLPEDPKNIGQFLLNQRKGPIQFLITFLIKFADQLYTNQLLIRLPFAIAGFLAVYYFYKLIKAHFGSKVALYSSLLLATNGFFVAFARIAQYQSFVILFSVLCLYALTLAVNDPKFRVKGIYLSMIFWAIALLAHYDAVFILPVVVVLLVQWLKKTDLKFGSKAKSLSLSFLLFGLLTLSFYVPFALYVSQDTQAYWQGRLTGDVSSKLSSSYYLFTVYQPIYIVHFYLGFGLLCGVALLFALLPSRIRKFLSKLWFLNTLSETSDQLIHKQVGLNKFFTLLFWFAIPYMFWEHVVYIPGTHIYTYLLPAFVLIGLGILYLETIWLKLMAKVKVIKPELVKNIVMSSMFGFIFLQSYAIYVDNVKEYPWQEERFLIWTFPKPTPIFHLSMFGFPYFRDWESIGRFVGSHPEVTAYSTNERESISRHHIKIEKDTDKAGFYVYIRHPQSFTNDIINQKALYWSSKYPPVYTMSKGGTDLVNIYLMPAGTIEEIQALGF